MDDSFFVVMGENEPALSVKNRWFSWIQPKICGIHIYNFYFIIAHTNAPSLERHSKTKSHNNLSDSFSLDLCILIIIDVTNHTSIAKILLSNDQGIFNLKAGFSVAIYWPHYLTKNWFIEGQKMDVKADRAGSLNDELKIGKHINLYRSIEMIILKDETYE